MRPGNPGAQPRQTARPTNPSQSQSTNMGTMPLCVMTWPAAAMSINSDDTAHTNNTATG